MEQNHPTDGVDLHSFGVTRERSDLKHSCDGIWEYYEVLYVAAVTEDEVALALTEGEEVYTPPGSLHNQLSTNGHTDVETENDPLNYNMEETK